MSNLTRNASTRDNDDIDPGPQAGVAGHALLPLAGEGGALASLRSQRKLGCGAPDEGFLPGSRPCLRGRRYRGVDFRHFGDAAFPEVVGALGALKRQGFGLCIISNTDDDDIAGNVAQLGGSIDRVITAHQAQAYKPAPAIFGHTHRTLGVGRDEVVQICASPHLDHAAARDRGFRCIWIDRGTGRTLLPDFVPNRTFATLDEVPSLFRTLGWDRGGLTSCRS